MVSSGVNTEATRAVRSFAQFFVRGMPERRASRGSRAFGCATRGAASGGDLPGIQK